MPIKVTYSPDVGLVQKRGSGGFSIGSFISYLYSLENAVSVSSDITVSSESFIVADATNGDLVITLPSAQGGRLVSIKKIDASSNTVTIATPNSETIDGGVSAVITTQWTSLTLQAINGNWFIR